MGYATPMFRRAFVRARSACTAALLAGCVTPLDFPTPVLGPCDKNHGGCDVNAICSVAVEATTATCICKPGFTGDGTTCSPVTDAGITEASPDAGGADAGTPDAGGSDGGSPDADIPDASVDGG